MKSIRSTGYSVHFEESSYRSLEEYLRDNFCSRIFVLVDSNTRRHCLPAFLAKAGLEGKVDIMEIPAGEKQKNLETCSRIWTQLRNAFSMPPYA